MAAIFQLSQASLWMRTRVMPRWMALVTIVVALLLLFVFTQAWWVVLVFPAWVLLVSVYILIAQPAQGRGAAGEHRT
jgi:L-asparagine transporter-like permease